MGLRYFPRLVAMLLKSWFEVQWILNFTIHVEWWLFLPILLYLFFLHLISNKGHFFRHLLNFCCPATVTIFLGRCGIWIAHRSDHLGHNTTSWQFSRSTSPSGEGHEHSGDVLSAFSRWRSSGMVWNLLAQWVRKPFPEGRTVSPQLGEAWFFWNKSMSLFEFSQSISLPQIQHCWLWRLDEAPPQEHLEKKPDPPNLKRCVYGKASHAWVLGCDLHVVCAVTDNPLNF